MPEPSSRDTHVAAAHLAVPTDPVAQPPVAEAPAASFRFVRATDKDETPLEWEAGVPLARTWLSEALNAKNVAFLLGAGCSSLKVDESGTSKEEGIPTMVNLAEEFLASIAGELTATGAAAP